MCDSRALFRLRQTYKEMVPAGRLRQLQRVAVCLVAVNIALFILLAVR